MRAPDIQLMLAVVLGLVLAACAAPQDSAPPAGAPTAVVADPPQLDGSCQADIDCEVKDVGSCCGRFPACVNASAQPDPEAVAERCAEAGMATVCGFREIRACACVQQRCQAAHQSPVPE